MLKYVRSLIAKIIERGYRFVLEKNEKKRNNVSAIYSAIVRALVNDCYGVKSTILLPRIVNSQSLLPC